MKFFNYLFIITFVIIFFGLLSGCKSCDVNKSLSKVTTAIPFSIVKSYNQKWISGVQGGGSGEDLYLEINQISEGVQLKKLYFRNKITEVKKSKESIYVGHFKTNEIGFVEDNARQNEVINLSPSEFPFQLKDNEGVLSYQYGHKIYHHKIANIIEKEVMLYPIY